MIRIEIDDARLRAGIDAKSETWLDDAKATMAANTPDALGDKPKWSKVKPVYIHAQHGKCGYCERKLAKDPSYRPMWRSYDVEHYRPKGATKIWPPAKLAEERQLAYPQWLPRRSSTSRSGPTLSFHWGISMTIPPI
ncbi:MAG: hypothetical protein AAGF11_23980 [Myxococcota bacterium]